MSAVDRRRPGTVVGALARRPWWPGRRPKASSWRRAAASSLAFAGLCLVATLPPAFAADALAYRSEEPRGFGWRLGDVVMRRFEIDVPGDYLLDDSSLPTRGRGGPLELRAARVVPRAEGITLELEYQIFVSPAEPRRLDLPALTLRFDPRAAAGPAATPARALEMDLQPWPLVVGPLVGDPAPSGRAFGEWRPDVESIALPTTSARRGLMVAGIVAAMLAATLALRPAVQAWLWRRRRPFAVARRAVREALPAGPDGLDNALRHLHAGFNQHAGQVLMHDDALALVAATPDWRPLADAIGAFFEASRARFFGVGTVPPGFDVQAVRRLADELAAIERVQGARPPAPSAVSGAGRTGPGAMPRARALDAARPAARKGGS